MTTPSQTVNDTIDWLPQRIVAPLCELLDTPTVCQPQLVAIATVKQLLVSIVQITEHGVVARHEAAERAVGQILRWFVRLPFLLPIVVEQGGRGVLVGCEEGGIQGFLGGFPGLRVQDIHDYSVVIFFREIAHPCVTRQPGFQSCKVGYTLNPNKDSKPQVNLQYSGILGFTA